MLLETIDWIIIVAYFALSIGLGLHYSKGAGESLNDFFLGGRNLSWWVAGVSMVATTFAADTPLAVAEIVQKKGIAGNWVWWSFLSGGMLTTFFFAKLWRKAEVLTEVEFIELRYSGAGARFLRGFKAVYLGLFMNTIIIAWVNVAMISILEVFLGVSHDIAMLYTAGAMLITAVYSSISGLMGVAITDAVQFFLAMLGCIILAYLVVESPEIGGIVGLKAKIDPKALDFFPTIGADVNGMKTMGISISAFFAYMGVQWWASWYPGAEPGGGGYVAQRLMSTRSEKDAVFATLFFQIAHYCVRPWPWILVGLCATVLYPNLDGADVKMGYVYAMRDYLPAGLRGMLLVAFLAAYMSTIATQLNWGASYIVNDLYRRFLRPSRPILGDNSAYEGGETVLDFDKNNRTVHFDGNDSPEDEKHYVFVSRVVTLILMVLGLAASTQITSISGAWTFIMACGAGLGLVLILRWYWWRINVWSEITATLAPFVAMGALYFAGEAGIIDQAFLDEFPNSFLITVAFTTIAWLFVTFITPSEDFATLKAFYKKVEPDGAWQPFMHYGGINTDRLNDAGIFVDLKDFMGRDKRGTLISLIICWASAIIMTYSSLFMLGKLIFLEWTMAAVYAVVALVSFFILRHFLDKTNVLD